MSNKNISIELREDAKKKNLCDAWYNQWDTNTSKQGLIDKYFEGLDFPMRYHWPSNDYIKENFEKELLRQNNILVDDKYSLLNPQEAVILGNTETTVRVNGNNRSVIYIRDSSTVKLYARNTAFVIVHLFENASISIHVLDNPNFLVLKHSHSVDVITNGEIKIKDDFDYLK